MRMAIDPCAVSYGRERARLRRLWNRRPCRWKKKKKKRDLPLDAVNLDGGNVTLFRLDH